MLRTRLLTATAAVALLTAGSAFAQSAPIATPSTSATTTTSQTVIPPAAPDSTPPAAGDAPDTPAAIEAQEATAPAAPAQTADATQNTVVDVLRANGQFTTLLSALDAAQLTDTLKTQPAISIFAPTDAAFAALPEAERTRLLDPANVNELRQVLLYHVIVADVNSSQIEGAKGGVQTAATTEVQLDGTGDAIKVDDATVTTADIDAGNGSIFVIDRVLNPAQSLVASGDAEETAAPAADADTAAAPVDEVTPPADSATADSMDADSATDEGAVAPPPTTPAAPAATAPTAPAAVPSPTTTTTTTRPATGVTAPNGQPAATTTTVASPTVPNPTDGQVDDEDADDADETPTPAPVPTPQA